MEDISPTRPKKVTAAYGVTIGEEGVVVKPEGAYCSKAVVPKPPTSSKVDVEGEAVDVKGLHDRVLVKALALWRGWIDRIAAGVVCGDALAIRGDGVDDWPHDASVAKGVGVVESVQAAAFRVDGPEVLWTRAVDHGFDTVVAVDRNAVFEDRGLAAEGGRPGQEEWGGRRRRKLGADGAGTGGSSGTVVANAAVALSVAAFIGIESEWIVGGLSGWATDASASTNGVGDGRLVVDVEGGRHDGHGACAAVAAPRCLAVERALFASADPVLQGALHVARSVVRSGTGQRLVPVEGVRQDGVVDCDGKGVVVG